MKVQLVDLGVGKKKVLVKYCDLVFMIWSCVSIAGSTIFQLPLQNDCPLFGGLSRHKHAANDQLVVEFSLQGWWEAILELANCGSHSQFQGISLTSRSVVEGEGSTGFTCVGQFYVCDLVWPVFMICFRVSIDRQYYLNFPAKCPFFGGVRHKHAATGLLVVENQFLRLVGGDSGT